MKKFLRIFFGLFIVLVLILIIRTITYRSMQIEVEPAILPVFGVESVENLASAITYPTVSYDVGLPVDTPAFLGFHQFLNETYPLVHATLKKEIFSEFSLLYTWEGINPELNPVILMAHFDVVPAGETDAWEKPPFSGENDGTFIWGRGTLDDKGALIAILEAVERLISEAYIFPSGMMKKYVATWVHRALQTRLKKGGWRQRLFLMKGWLSARGSYP